MYKHYKIDWEVKKADNLGHLSPSHAINKNLKYKIGYRVKLREKYRLNGMR